MRGFNSKLGRFGTKLIGKYVQKVDKMTQFQINQIIMKEVGSLKIKGLEELSDTEEAEDLNMSEQEDGEEEDEED